ncbi:hypothetical protein [Streptomyces sp. NBC_01262]|uniref:hypothetical protein n=1 Tax=Streptomyces sp. NBC_01262 TaxID=2903803 RepID=UPI002E353747|nr:hypothetical protein [Streptomyces sp. NBC_01262]
MSTQPDPSDEEFARQMAELVGNAMQPMFDGINSFMRAPTDQAAMQVLQQNPGLLTEQARQVIRKGIKDARGQGEIVEAENMDRRLRLLESQV